MALTFGKRPRMEGIVSIKRAPQGPHGRPEVFRQRSVLWCLEGLQNGVSGGYRTEISSFPFRIGRHPECELRLGDLGVSLFHAEITRVGDRFVLRDLGSTNGTFLNLEPLLSAQEITVGDLIQIADREFRFLRVDGEIVPGGTTARLDVARIQAARRVFGNPEDFGRLIEAGAIDTVLQPVVRLPQKTGAEPPVGYELFGRAHFAGLPETAAELFPMAEAANLAVELSEAFRDNACETAHRLGGDARFFLNTHPLEMQGEEKLLRGLQSVRARYPGLSMILEIHELAVSNLDAFRKLCHGLTDLGIDIAFDDFGKGQDRFLELAYLSPAYLKFDRRLLQRLDVAEDKRFEMVRTLVGMVRDMGISAVAEGVETAGEAQVCEELGFDLAQGFFYGAPMSFEEIAAFQT